MVGPTQAVRTNQALSLLLPKTADRLYRTINGRLGYYAGHVYDECLVQEMDHSAEAADVITLVPVDTDDPPCWQGDLRTVVPVDADVPMWQGDLRSGRIGSARALNG